MNFLRRFMAGRYGSDQLNNALLLLAIVIMVIEWVMKWNWMSMFILALFILCYFRMFSRNIQARYAENQKFLQKWGPVSRRLHNAEKPLIAQIQDGFLIFDAKYRNVGRYSA